MSLADGGSGPREQGVRVAIDIGGTFTDVVVTAGTRIVHTAKVLTTYERLLEAVEAGIEAGLRRLPADVEMAQYDGTTLLHATTLVSNAYIERKGADVSVVVTKGFRDLLDLGDGSRFDPWDLNVDVPWHFVSAEEVFEVDERCSVTGEELIPVKEDEILALAGGLKGSVAVALLHAYADPAHEQEVERLLRAARPDLDVTISSRLSREVGEVPRLVTTVANAYVRPLMRPYLAELRRSIAAITGRETPILVMSSNGGLAPVDTVADAPVRIAESGPAAGVRAAHAYAAGTRLLSDADRRIVSLDMGGTTAKIAFADGEATLRLRSSMEVARDRKLRTGSGIPLAVSSLDLVEVGAGGGSVAHRNAFGLVEVGPESAASQPGPAAYGRGGTRPTVTDANVVLGYIPPGQRLGGVEALHVELARAAVGQLREGTGDESDRPGLTETEIEGVALAVHDVANEHMAGAIRVAASERGLRAEDHTMVAFGGAAPLHACGVARGVGIRRVLIPPEPGVFSALGLALAPVSYEAARTFRVLLPFGDAEHAEALAHVGSMRDEIREVVGDTPTETVIADIRFRGQGSSISVALGSQLPDGAAVHHLFAAEYRRLYSRFPDAPAEIAVLRLQAIGASPNVALNLGHMSDGQRASAAAAVFADQLREPSRLEVAVLPRTGELRQGTGPALITEQHTTTVVPPGWNWLIDETGAIALEDGLSNVEDKERA